jgi:PAS domain S-box-containing protein
MERKAAGVATEERLPHQKRDWHVLDMLLSSFTEFAYAFDRDGRLLYANQALLDLWGTTPEDAVGKNFADLKYPAELAVQLQRQIDEVFATGERIVGETNYPSPSGVSGYYQYTFSGVVGIDGNVEFVVGASHDVTARKGAQEHLVALEASYSSLLEAAPDAMVVVATDGKIVLLNLQAEHQFGYSRDELIGQQVKRIIPEGFAERLIADETRTAAEALAQQIGTGIELIGRRRDGSEFPIEIMLSPLEINGETVVTAAIRDITVRKEAEANLVQKIEELNRSNEELEQFAYVASHDLQEPLRMVASYTQLLSKRYKGRLDSDADEFIAYAVDGAKRMQRLIQDLLTYSRVGKRGLELLGISSDDALRQALANLSGAVEESGAVVTHGPLPEVMADEVQLVQLFQNLIGNAIKYRGTEVPHIHISAVKNGAPKWLFSVKDNGLGIEPQYFERIFGMFQRLHKRDEFDGTGMGLAICKKIVERHGGAVSVESQPGHGSTFRFDLAASEQRL